MCVRKQGTTLWISIDPGGVHTAVLCADNVHYGATVDDFSFDLVSKCMFRFEQRKDIVRYINCFTETYRTQRIIIEDFKLQERKASDQINSRFETVKVIERITVACERLGLTHLIKIQQPMERLSVKTCPPAHDAFLHDDAGSDYRHYWASYQHLRYYLLTRHRNVCALEPFHCPTCGYFLHGDSTACWNCNVKLNRKHEART